MRRLDLLGLLFAICAALMLVPALRPTGGVLVEVWRGRAPALFLLTGALIVVGPRLARRLLRLGGLPPPATDRQGHLRMFAFSFCALLLELALIRWIGSEVRVFAYFKNFVLISAYLGFGLGFALGTRTTRLLPLAFLGFPLVALLVYFWNDAVLYPALAGEEQTWGHNVAGARPAELTFMLVFFVTSLFSFFVAVVVSFAALTQQMGRLFTQLPRLPAYATNLLGSLAGVIAFNLLSWSETGPAVWLVAGLAPLALVLPRPALRKGLAVAIVLTAGLAFLTDSRESGGDDEHTWSPYYRVSVGKWDLRLPDGLPSPPCWKVSVNRVFMAHGGVIDPRIYQRMFGRPMPPTIYELPFQLKPDAKRVLILGAGLGNDLAAAVRLTPSAEIVGVELDPAIARYGAQVHPERPHANERVSLVVADARHYVETSRERYDLILMSSLDSHTLLSAYTQVRTDNFLYTKEAFESVRRLLSPEGVFVVTYATDRPWLLARIAAALRAAFGQEPLVAGRGHAFCAIGPGVPKTLPPLLAGWVSRNAVRAPPPDQAYPSDDRPFLTLRSRWLPTTYWVAMMCVLSMTLIALRSAKLPVRSIDLRFFCLGAAFLLAETRLITMVGLLFGVTWVAYGLAITVVLVTLVAGTVAVLRLLFLQKSRWPLYALLVAVLLGSQLVPPRLLLDMSGPARFGLALAIYGPTFFMAAVVFARDLAEVEKDAVPRALSSNLLGAVIGGLLEYQAITLGIGSLAISAAILYGVAACWRRR